jgi:hypothetical protein
VSCAVLAERCVFAWTFSPHLLLKRLPQSVQTNGFSPVCVRKCRVRLHFWANPRPHRSHEKGFLHSGTAAQHLHSQRSARFARAVVCVRCGGVCALSGVNSQMIDETALLCERLTCAQTTQHSTAQHSTAQHSTAQHSTAQCTAHDHTEGNQRIRQGVSRGVGCGAVQLCCYHRFCIRTAFCGRLSTGRAMRSQCPSSTPVRADAYARRRHRRFDESGHRLRLRHHHHHHHRRCCFARGLQRCRRPHRRLQRRHPHRIRRRPLRHRPCHRHRRRRRACIRGRGQRPLCCAWTAAERRRGEGSPD